LVAEDVDEAGVRVERADVRPQLARERERGDGEVLALGAPRNRFDVEHRLERSRFARLLRNLHAYGALSCTTHALFRLRLKPEGGPRPDPDGACPKRP